MRPLPQLNNNEIRVLETISRGIVPGDELPRRTGIEDRTELFEAVMVLLKQDLIEASPPIYDEKQIRKTVFSTRPSRQYDVRQVLTSKYE